MKKNKHSEDNIHELASDVESQSINTLDGEIEIAKRHNRLPFKPLIAILGSCAPEGIGEAITVPFLFYMVQDLIGKDASPATIAATVGAMGSAFYAPLFVMNILMGTISDRFGRRPAILTGCIGNAVGVLLFGLSKTLPQAFIARFIAGLFGFNSTVAKSLLGEISTPVTRPRAFALYGVMFGSSTMIAPLLGGYLVRPTETLPSVFGGNQFLQTFPYFLPCLFSATLGLLAFVMAYFWIPRNSTTPRASAPSYTRVSPRASSDELDVFSPTASFSLQQKDADVANEEGSTSCAVQLSATNPPTLRNPHRYDDTPKTPISPSPSIPPSPSHSTLPLRQDQHQQNQTTSLAPSSSKVGGFFGTVLNELKSSAALLRYPTVFFSIMIYSCIAFYFSLYFTITSIWLPSPISDFGLEYTSERVGYSNSTYGLVKLIIQLTIFPYILRTIGLPSSLRLGIFFFALTTFFMPFISFIPDDTTQFICVLLSSGVAAIGDVFGYLSILIAITESVPSYKLGFAHGLSSTTAASVRMVGPSVAGLSWSLGVSFGSVKLTFWLMTMLAGVAAILTFFRWKWGDSGRGTKPSDVDDNEEM